MLTSLQRMIGLPVILRDCRIGTVERAFADDSLQRLEGIVVRRGIGGARWLQGSRIVLAGKSCLIADSTPSRMPRMAEERVRYVYLATGEYAGVVSDVVLEGETLVTEALEISQGLSSRMRGRCLYALQYTAGLADGCVTAEKLLTWPQLRRQFGEEDER